MPASLLVVVRHGRTEWNATGRFQGRADPPLDEVGEEQAIRVGAELADWFARAGWPPPTILSSDLKRAAATAAAVATAFSCAYRTDPALREVDVGGWEGLTRAEAERRFPEEFTRWAAGCDVARGGRETLAAAGRRVARRIAGALERVPEGTLLVVAHGMALQSALGQLRAGGSIVFSGEPPHLGNGCWFSAARPPPIRR